MTGPGPTSAQGGCPPSELDKLRLRVTVLTDKRKAAEGRLRDLLGSLLALDDVLADSLGRTADLHAARSARQTASAALALGEQIEAAHLMLRRELERHDVSPMDVVGRAVDPAEMHVVGTEPHPNHPGGTVLREEATGFRRGSAVLRPARVIVTVPGPDPVPEPEPVRESVPGAAPVRAQPRRTTRSQRRLLPKPSAVPGHRRSRRT